MPRILIIHTEPRPRNTAGVEKLGESASGRMRAYGAAKTIDHTAVSLPDALRHAHPEMGCVECRRLGHQHGVDALLDLVSDATAFAALASLVRRGGTAVTTQYVGDEEALRAAGIIGVNFALPSSRELFERVAEAVADGRIVAPPISRISLEEVPAGLSSAWPGSGKTVITP